jgi:hypothetical protein
VDDTLAYTDDHKGKHIEWLLVSAPWAKMCVGHLPSVAVKWCCEKSRIVVRHQNAMHIFSISNLAPNFNLCDVQPRGSLGCQVPQAESRGGEVFNMQQWLCFVNQDGGLG